MKPDWWRYDNLESIDPQWEPAAQGDSEYDNIDFHLDLGCGRIKKARLGIDHLYSPGVDALIDLNELRPPLARPGAVLDSEEMRVHQRTHELYDREIDLARREQRAHHSRHILPFPSYSIKSIITHHVFEHIGTGFMRLMDECYRVLDNGGILRIIVPAFPSAAAVGDPTHVRYFTESTWVSFEGPPVGPFFSDGFAEPYTKARFELLEVDMSPYPFVHDDPSTGVVDIPKLYGKEGAREFRVAYRKR